MKSKQLLNKNPGFTVYAAEVRISLYFKIGINSLN